MDKRKILFLISGFLPLISVFGKPIDSTLWIYSVFVLLYFLGPKITLFLKRIPLNFYFKFFLIVIIAGFLVEFFAWLGEYFSCNKKPILFHPQLFYDLLIGIGFYGGWALAWLIVLRKYNFTLKQVFITLGLYGVFIEQQGAVFFQGLMSMPLGLYLWFYVFIVYASAGGIFYTLAKNSIPFVNQADEKRKYVFVLILMLIFSMLLLILWTSLLKLFNLTPVPKPICSYPLW